MTVVNETLAYKIVFMFDDGGVRGPPPVDEQVVGKPFTLMSCAPLSSGTKFHSEELEVIKNHQGQITNMPVLAWSAFRKGPASMQNFVNTFYGPTQNFVNDYYQNPRPDDRTLKFFSLALEQGCKFGIYASSPYYDDVKSVVRSMGLHQYFSYSLNVYDMVRGCEPVLPPSKKVNGHNNPCVDQYFKPSSLGYRLALKALWDHSVSEQLTIYIDDIGYKKRPVFENNHMAVWVNSRPIGSAPATVSTRPPLKIRFLSDMVELHSLCPELKAQHQKSESVARTVSDGDQNHEGEARLS